MSFKECKNVQWHHHSVSPCDGLQNESEKAQHESALRTMLVIKIGSGTNVSHSPCSLKIINPYSPVTIRSLLVIFIVLYTHRILKPQGKGATAVLFPIWMFNLRLARGTLVSAASAHLQPEPAADASHSLAHQSLPLPGTKTQH